MRSALRNILFCLFACTLAVAAGAQIVVTTPIPATAKIVVHTDQTAAYTIPRTIFGTFLEPIGNSINQGLWAQILVNPSLESGLWTPRQVRAMLAAEPSLANASDLGIPLPWEPLDLNQGFRYEPRYGHAANSWRSLEVIGVPGQPTGVPSDRSSLAGVEPTGIRQKVYLAVHRTWTYQGSLYAKHLSGATGLTIQIRRRNSSDVLASATVPADANTWTKYHFSLTLPPNSLHRLDPADFVVELNGDERVDLDQITLFPSDAIDGLDPDAVAMAKAMHTPLVRFGGNFTSGYHWRDGIGPSDTRVSMLNTSWGIPEYNTFGTDEFLRFCKLIGAQPQIALNLGSGTPQEEADWVKYVDDHFNGGNGGLHWELGNELWGNWNMGWPTLAQLSGRTLAFSQAVKQVDPTAVLIATGRDPDGYQQWNAAQLTNPSGTFDFLSAHFVVGAKAVLPNPTPEFLAQAMFALPVELGRRLHAMQMQIDQTPAFVGKAHLAFTEWLFSSHRNSAPDYANMGGAIDAAGMLTMLMRNANIVPISDMTGLMEFGGIWKKRSQVYATPPYYAFRMIASADAFRTVAVDSEAGSYSVHRGIARLPEIPDVPYLDTVAALDSTGNILTLFCINRSLTRDIPAEIDLKHFRAARIATAQVLQANSLYDGNDEVDPHRVVPVDSTIQLSSGPVSYKFPHESVTVLTFHRR
jgi:alpha-L-arabinofuranosidase